MKAVLTSQKQVFRVLECCDFLTDTAQDTAALKKQVKSLCGTDTRRMSRLTLLALAGVAQIGTPSEANVYLGSAFSSPQTFNRLLRTLRTDDVPKPFDFIANINNAAAFRSAAWLNSHGNALFLALRRDAWAQPLLCALSDLTLGRCTQALIGWVHEHRPQCDVSPHEGSHWLLVRAETCPERSEPSAPTPHVWPFQETDYYWQNIVELSARIRRGETVCVDVGLQQHITLLAAQAVSSSSLLP